MKLFLILCLALVGCRAELQMVDLQNKKKLRPACYVKREGNIDLVGLECKKRADGMIWVITATAMAIPVHPSRVRWPKNSLKVLQEPYKERSDPSC